jgi:hypothetical protein
VQAESGKISLLINNATEPLYLRAIFSISGKKRITHRLIVKWSTDTPHSSIIFSKRR